MTADEAQKPLGRITISLEIDDGLSVNVVDYAPHNLISASEKRAPTDVLIKTEVVVKAAYTVKSVFKLHLPCFRLWVFA